MPLCLTHGKFERPFNDVQVVVDHASRATDPEDSFVGRKHVEFVRYTPVGGARITSKAGGLLCAQETGAEERASRNHFYARSKDGADFAGSWIMVEVEQVVEDVTVHETIHGRPYQFDMFAITETQG